MNSKTENYKKIIVPIITKYLINAKIILYGSRARKDDTQGSDIDIAIDMGKKIEYTILSMIIDEIENSELPILFDIVDFNNLSESMKKEINKDGTIWKK